MMVKTVQKCPSQSDTQAVPSEKTYYGRWGRFKTTSHRLDPIVSTNGTKRASRPVAATAAEGIFTATSPPREGC